MHASGQASIKTVYDLILIGIDCSFITSAVIWTWLECNGVSGGIMAGLYLVGIAAIIKLFNCRMKDVMKRAANPGMVHKQHNCQWTSLSRQMVIVYTLYRQC